MLNIAIVDDHSAIRWGIEAALSNQLTDIQFKIVGAFADGRKFIEEAPLLDINLVILDLIMPRMNGMETTVHLLREFPAIKIIQFSAVSEGRFVAEALRAGVRAYVKKGSDISDLALAVRHIIAEKEPFVCAETSEVLSRYVMLEKKLAEFQTSGERILKVLELVTQGLNTNEIAAELNLGFATVKHAREDISSWLGSGNPIVQTRIAQQMGFVSELNSLQYKTL